MCDIPLSLIERAHPGVSALKPYEPGKAIEELQREFGISEAVKLASNENPLGPSPLAIEAMQQELSELARYPDGAGFNLKEKLASKQGVTMSQITLGNGSNDVLELIARSFVREGGEVIFSEHAFAVYYLATQAVGGKSVVVPAKDWGHDLDAMRAAVSDNTRVIFIANPNNPTGTWLDGTSLEGFIAALPEYVLVVIDEAYFEYASDAGMGAINYPDASSWLKKYPNLVVTRTFSKAYGLAGLRIGYALSHESVADLLNRVRQPFNVNSLALVAASKVLDDNKHLDESLENNCAGYAQLTSGFTKLGLEYIPSVGNFVCVDVGKNASVIYDALLREGVIVRPIANYGMPRHLRITIGLPNENERLLNALKMVLSC
jgi:histidinol-phosphate aminotransferase